MVDHLDGDPPGLGRGERAAHGAVERRPRRLVDLGAQRTLQLLVGLVGTREVGVPHEEALAVVVGVDEPAGDIVGAVAAHLTGRRVVDVHALEGDLEIAGHVHGRDVDVGLAEDHEEVAGAGLLEQFVTHAQVGVHARGEHLQCTVALRLLGDVWVEREAAHDQDVVTHAEHGFLGGFLDLARSDRAVLRPDRDGNAADLAVGVGVCPCRMEPRARERLEPVEHEPLALDRVLHAGLAQVVENHRLELARRIVALRHLLAARTVVVCGQHAVRRQALDGERPRHADALVVLVRLVVQQFGVGVAEDGGVDLRPRHAFRDVGVVGNRLQRHVRHALVDEALADVTVGLVRRRHLAGELGLLLLALRRIGEQVPREARRHQPRPGKRQRHAARVAGDPATSPLLCDVCGGA